MGERTRLTPQAASNVARWVPLLTLTAINLLNYIDRYVITSVLPSIQHELQFSDLQAGLLGTAFMVVYFVVSPLFGLLGDRSARPPLLALGVALWSLATAATGLCSSFAALFVARAAVGVGESAYGSIAPSLITDLFKRLQYGRALALFYLATPVGSALGYLIGGVLGERVGWRETFFWVGLPGLLVAALAARLQDPVRQVDAAKASPGGDQAAADTAAKAAAPTGPGSWGTMLREHARLVMRTLWPSRLYVRTVAGLTAYTFGLGGFAFWAPSFMMRERHYPPHDGMLMFGGITVVTGAVGTLLGGNLGDWLRRKTVKGYSLLNTIAAASGGVFASVSLACESERVFLVCLALAQLSLFMVTGPVNALIVGVVPSAMRSTAMATSIFCIHLFGDAISPVIIGKISDGSSLRQAMTLIPIAFFISSAIWATTLPARRLAAGR